MFEEITLKGGARVVLKTNAWSECKKCKKPILWAVTAKNAKNIPICKDESEEWIAHFADCKFVKDFRKGEPDDLSRQKTRDSWFSKRR